MLPQPFAIRFMQTKDGIINEKDILTNAGKVTADIAKFCAENEYEKYRVIQDRLMESDFDKEIKKQLGGAFRRVLP